MTKALYRHACDLVHLVAGKAANGWDKAARIALTAIGMRRSSRFRVAQDDA
jgi:hypothetical protein